jgi:hypothetical protein
MKDNRATREEFRLWYISLDPNVARDRADRVRVVVGADGNDDLKIFILEALEDGAKHLGVASKEGAKSHIDERAVRADWRSLGERSRAKPNAFAAGDR